MVSQNIVHADMPGVGDIVSAKDVEGLDKDVPALLQTCRDASVAKALLDGAPTSMIPSRRPATQLNLIAAFVFPERYGLPGEGPLLVDGNIESFGHGKALYCVDRMFDDVQLVQLGVEPEPAWLDDARKVMDKFRLWQHALEGAGAELCLSGEFFASFEKNRDAALRFSELLGSDGLFAAHAAGVPMEDILA